ncbi:putative glycosyltransferase EpsH [Abditibacteriota bacterium]|nr:putative glycosyltransferase EpsH [Abditibacteriota bacterium]
MPTLSSENPLVSVIIPAYNVAHYLNEALESVRAQTYRCFEIIVVDDSSTDETPLVAQSGGDVRYYRQERQGGGSARNKGISLAKGELLAFLDADDLWSADKLLKQVEFYMALPPTQFPTVLYAHARQFFSPELDEASRSNIHLPAHDQRGYLAGTLLITPTDFCAIGPYGAIFGDCVDWHLRALDAGAQIHVLPDVMLFRRIHGTNMSRTQSDDKRQYVRSLKASLDRRRQQASEENTKSSTSG